MAKKKETNEYTGLDVVKIRLVKEASMLSDEPVRDVEDAVNVIKKYLSDFDREAFCILNLANDGKPISVNVASIGTLNGALVTPRETFKSCILSNAAGFIAFHCHPSGNPKPSRDDAEVTQRLRDAGKVLDIKMVDHIIVGCGSEMTFSFAAEGLMTADDIIYEYSNRVAERRTERYHDGR